MAAGVSAECRAPWGWRVAVAGAVAVEVRRCRMGGTRDSGFIAGAGDAGIDARAGAAKSAGRASSGIAGATGARHRCPRLQQVTA